MIDTSNLQQTVAAAQQAFARTSEEHVRSRKNLAGLVNIVEESLREKRDALAQNEAERERMIRDYGHLRHMLHALVMTVEVGPREDLASIPAPAEAGMEPGARMGPVSLDPAANDTGPAGNGGGENGPARKGGDDSENLRAGLKRVINKKRAQAAKADKPEEPAPAN